jgi:hypothetical protein
MRITITLPTTPENIDKARNFVRLANREFERRGMGRRLRLFAGDVEERLLAPQYSFPKGTATRAPVADGMLHGRL